MSAEEIPKQAGNVEDQTGAFKSSQEEPFQILTDGEQRKMLKERALEVVKEIRLNGYSNLVFLDKSARPIQTLLRTVWDKKYHEESFPHVSFVNIGRETTRRLDEMMDKAIDKKVTPEMIAEFVGPAEMKRLRDKYSYLSDAPDGAKVLIIDEYSASGESLSLAKKILEVIFSQKDDPSHSRLAVDTLAFAQADGRIYSHIFRSEYGTYMAPWSFESLDPEYGMSGVVDPTAESLTAVASNKMSTEMRVDLINNEIERHRENLRAAMKLFYENGSFEKIRDGHARFHSLESIDPDGYSRLQELLGKIAVKDSETAKTLRATLEKIFEKKILSNIIKEEAAMSELEGGLADEPLNKLLVAYKRRYKAVWLDPRILNSVRFELVHKLLIRDEDGRIVDKTFYNLGEDAVSQFHELLVQTVRDEAMKLLETVQSSRATIEKLEKRKAQIIEMGESGRQQQIKKLRDEIKKLASDDYPVSK